MIKLIKLTKNSSSSIPVYVNADSIRYFFRTEDVTSIIFTSDNVNDKLLVRETPDEIAVLINGDENKKSLPSGNFGNAMRGNL